MLSRIRGKKNKSPLKKSDGSATKKDSPSRCNDGEIQDNGWVFDIKVMGENGVGKTSFIWKYMDDNFEEDISVLRMGAGCRSKDVCVASIKQTVRLWDTDIENNSELKIDGIVAMYDITDMSSFHALRGELENIDRYSNVKSKQVLVGTKSDLEAQRSVPKEKAKALADSLRIPFFEISLKNGSNVVDALHALIYDIQCKQR